MKAKQMFEKLGFEFEENEYFFEYRHKHTLEYVDFDKREPSYTTDVYTVKMPLQKAINQQLREMGYLDE